MHTHVHGIVHTRPRLVLQLRMCTRTWAWRGLRVSSAAHCAYKPSFGLRAAPAPGNAASGQGRAPGAAPDARLHTPQLQVRERRHLRVALEIRKETTRSVSLAYSPCVWWCLCLPCCCPAVAGVLCVLMHCPGVAGYLRYLQRIGTGLCATAAVQASLRRMCAIIVRSVFGCRLKLCMGLCPARACAPPASWAQAQPAAVANVSRDGRGLGSAAASTQVCGECKAARAPTARPAAAPVRTRGVAVGWSLQRS